MNTEFYPGEQAQGKRLLKVIQKRGVEAPDAFDYLLNCLRMVTMSAALNDCRDAGHDVDDAMMLAQSAVEAVRVPQHKDRVTGANLYHLMVANGAVPGRVKAELDTLFAFLVRPVRPQDAHACGWFRTILSHLDSRVVRTVGETNSPEGMRREVFVLPRPSKRARVIAVDEAAK